MILRRLSARFKEYYRIQNELMTTSEFIEKIMWLTMLNYNCFVIPIYEREKLTGLYPVKPLRVDFLQDVSGIFYIKWCLKMDMKQQSHIKMSFTFDINIQ